MRSFTQAELDSPLEQSKGEAFDKVMKGLYGNHKAPPLSDWIKRRKKSDNEVKLLKTDDCVDSIFGNKEKLGQEIHLMPEVDSYDDFDAYTDAEVLLPQNSDVM